VTIRAEAEHREALEHDLLQRPLRGLPRRFEAIVIELLVAMGTGLFRGRPQRIGRSADRGFDGIIKEDRLGLDDVYITLVRRVAYGFSGGNPSTNLHR
jgi:restriction system protein